MRKLSLALLTLCLLPQLALAQLSPEDTGLETTGEEVYGSIDDITIGSWVGIYIINPLMSLVGVIFLVLMIYGGFLWMTAGGNSSQVDKAKGILVNAIVGLIIVLASYAISLFVVEAITQ